MNSIDIHHTGNQGAKDIILLTSLCFSAGNTDSGEWRVTRKTHIKQILLDNESTDITSKYREWHMTKGYKFPCQIEDVLYAWLMQAELKSNQTTSLVLHVLYATLLGSKLDIHE